MLFQSHGWSGAKRAADRISEFGRIGTPQFHQHHRQQLQLFKHNICSSRSLWGNFHYIKTDHIIRSSFSGSTETRRPIAAPLWSPLQRLQIRWREIEVCFPKHGTYFFFDTFHFRQFTLQFLPTLCYLYLQGCGTERGQVENNERWLKLFSWISKTAYCANIQLCNLFFKKKRNPKTVRSYFPLTRDNIFRVQDGCQKRAC